MSSLHKAKMAIKAIGGIMQREMSIHMMNECFLLRAINPLSMASPTYTANMNIIVRTISNTGVPHMFLYLQLLNFVSIGEECRCVQNHRHHR